MRKIIQITATSCPQNPPIDTLYALCDDGSVWEATFTWSDKEWSPWRPLPAIFDVEEQKIPPSSAFQAPSPAGRRENENS